MMRKSVLITVSLLTMRLIRGDENEVYYRADSNDYYSEPSYYFGYSVMDPDTGDEKSQYEMRDGDTVRGYYSVNDPDGTIREVHYSADSKNGFKARVESQLNSHSLITPYFTSSVTHY